MRKIFILILFCTGEAIAQQPLSLQDAINISLKNSLDIKLARNNVEANTLLNNYGVAGGLPVVTGAASDNEQSPSINQVYSDPTRNTKKNNAASNSLNANITAGILLYNGMHVIATKNRLAELQLQSETALNAQIQNDIAMVMTGYYDIIRQESYLGTIDTSIEAAREKLSIVKTQQQVGMANNADLFQAEVDLNNLLQTRESQLLIIDQDKTDFLSLLNLKTDSSLDIRDTILVDKKLVLDDILNSLKNNPDITAADQEIRINELIVKETAASRYPSLRVSTGYTYGRTKNAAGFSLLNESYGPFAGLSLSVPIFNGTASKRAEQVAQINTRNAEIQKQTLVKDYTAQVIKMYQAYENNIRQLETARENYSLSEQLLRLVLNRFSLRQATLVDVKQAQQSFEDASYSLVNLSFAAKSAEIELKRLANSLGF